MEKLVEIELNELKEINGGASEAGGWGYKIGYAVGKMTGIFTNALEEAYTFIKASL